MNPIPATTEVLLEQIRAIGSFSSWSGSSAFAVEQIKTYCVPGNAKAAKGRMAIWVRGPAAKRPRILLPELVMLAMRFIAEPGRRGKHQHLFPGSFSMSVTGKEAKLPGVWNNNEIYLALARRLLGLPDDHVDETTERLQAESEKRWEDSHPDIRTSEGLFREVLVAYGEAMCGVDPESTDRDWVELCYRSLRSRHGSSSWPNDEAGQRADLAAVLRDVRSKPIHVDIRGIDIAVFAMLYLNGLAWAGKIRSSAVTTMVNRIADAAEDGILEPFLAKVMKAQHEMTVGFAKMLNLGRTGRTRT